LGRRSLPKIFFFLVVFAGEAGKHHEKKADLGEAGCPLGAYPNPSTKERR